MGDTPMSAYEVITSHRTIRRYKEHEMPREHLEKIIRSAIRAPSSSNLQAYCMIRIIDRELRRKIAELAGNQEHIIQASEFFVFVADLYRLIKVCEEFGGKAVEPNYLMLYVASVDAAIAAQNMVITAEELGYGTCYIGAIQNNPCEIAELLNLPRYTYPLFGLTIGIPDEDPALRPRLPEDALVHIDRYPSDDGNIKIALTAFKGTDFYDSFRRRISRYYSAGGRYRERYKKMKDCLMSRGFTL